MNLFISNAERIPLEERIEIIDVVLPEALAGNQACMSKLFAYYNDYVSPKGDEKDMSCGSCVNFVLMQFQNITRHWSSNQK